MFGADIEDSIKISLGHCEKERESFSDEYAQENCSRKSWKNREKKTNLGTKEGKQYEAEVVDEKKRQELKQKRLKGSQKAEAEAKRDKVISEKEAKEEA